MSQVLLALPFRLAAVATVSLAVAFGAGQIVSADESSQQNVTQTEVAIPGTETSTDGGSATAGPAVADTQAVVRQHNVQVAVGDEDALANSSQDATNQADVDQTATAVAGDATASDGGSASTGYAVATTTAVVVQMNVQVMALLAPDCAANQAASNDAQVTQDAAAMSGDAIAGAGSDAESGNARASARHVSVQRNVQIYICTPRHDGASSGDQQATNSLTADQQAAALSGIAEAQSDSQAATGDARAGASDAQHQFNRQIVVQ